MASPLNDAWQAMLTKLGTVTDDSGNIIFKFVWLDMSQIERALNGSGYSFETPTAFLDLKFNGEYRQLMGSGCSGIDMEWVITIADRQLNATDGTLDQNINIYAYRDAVKRCLTGFKLPYGGALQYDGKEERFVNQGELYAYKLYFRCHFIDSNGFVGDSWQIGTISDVNINGFDAWFPGKSYVAGKNVVLFPVDSLLVIYLCSVSNSDTVFNAGNWQLISAWEPNTSYTATTSYAAFNNHVYQCVISNSDAVFTPAKWTLIA